MNWYKLKNNICPRCHKDFVKGVTTRKSLERVPVGKILGTEWKNVEVVNFVHTCGFRINERKYNEIISDQVVRSFKS